MKLRRVALVRLIFSIYHWGWALFGALLFWFPSRKLYVIGVTGTKGKSTTAELISAGLEAAGKKTALLTSYRIKIDEESELNRFQNSMPGWGMIQSFLRKAVRARCEYAIIEVTSEGALQHRHRFIQWNAGVFINIHPEHIEHHGSFEAYRQAKVSFFRVVARSVKKDLLFCINKGDENYKYFEEAARLVSRARVLYFNAAEFMQKGFMGVALNDSVSRKAVAGWMGPEFQMVNAAAAATVLSGLHVSEQTTLEGFKKFTGVPGRMEYVQKEPFVVVVDYAHTPDSLEAVYKAVRSEMKEGARLIGVFGSCGGGRDKWKRLILGGVAGEYCDYIFITNEDPYDEKPEDIIREIHGGIARLGRNVEEIVDRREAISRAIGLAYDGDAVVITGKGSERWMRIGKGKKIPWSDVEVARGAIAEGRRQ